MKISAHIQNGPDGHHVTLQTNDRAHMLDIPPKATGPGSSVNGGELLFLALATCYCNDLYREAAQTDIQVQGVEIEVEGEFGAAGEPATGVTYRVKITARGREDAIQQLAFHTDRMAEIQNTLRAGTAVTLGRIEVIST